MKINQILIVLLVCTILQSEIILCSEEEGIEEIQPTQSWWRQAGGYMSSAAAIARKKAQQAVSSVKSTPSEWWSQRKKETEVISPIQKASGGAMFMGMSGAMAGAIGSSLDQKVGMALMSSSFIASLTEYFGGFVQGGLIPAMILSTAVPMFVLSYGIQKIFAYYHNQDIKRQIAVNQAKDLISLQLADTMTYPTRSSKLHALLKKNEFLVDTEDVDGIVDQACSELTQQFAAIKPGETQKANDFLVDAQISAIRASFIQKQITTLDDQIADVSKDIKDILTALEDPVIKAKISVLRRLEQQKFEEEISTFLKVPGKFAQTSSAKFYQPMTEAEVVGFEERKKAWETGMKEAEKKTTAWEKSKE